MNQILNDQLPRRKLTELCRRYHIRKLSLFGSALRDDFSPASDLDILVEFDPHHIPGLAFFEIQDELSVLLKRQVDWTPPRFLSPIFRRQVMQ